jgi:hypothetical protein
MKNLQRQIQDFPFSTDCVFFYRNMRPQELTHSFSKRAALSGALILFLISTFAGFSQADSGDAMLNRIDHLQGVLNVNKSREIIVAEDTLMKTVENRTESPEDALYAIEFYRNLRHAAEKSFLTRRLHELVIRPRTAFPDDFSEGDPNNEFSPHEGKRIRQISINRLNVFGEDIEPARVTASIPMVEKVGNRMHIKTNPSLIRRNLLFEEGDLVDPQDFTDSERLLRGLSQIEDARIYLLEDPFLPAVVDVIILTRDFWSKGFDLEFTEPTAGVLELYDRNFLGFGRELQINLLFDTEENPWLGYEGLFRAANLYGTFIDGGIRYQRAFDQHMLRVSLDRSFFTPDIKYAGGGSFQYSSRIADLDFIDSVLINQPLSFHMQDYWFGRSFSLKRSNKSSFRSGLVTSARVQRIVFFDRPPISDSLLYRFHNRTLVLTGLAWTRQDFFKSRYVYGLGQSEDIPFGSIVQLTGGFENNQFFNRTYLSSRIAQAFLTDRVGFFFSEVSIGSFFNGSAPEQSVLSMETKWFSPLSRLGKFNMRLFSHLRYLKGGNRFEDEFISLNDELGIRGLHSTELSGNHKLAINLESVFISPATVLGFRIAWFTFTDFGWIGFGKGSVLKQNFYGGIGMGAKVRSELMVFPSLVLRLSVYPVIPSNARFETIWLGSEKPSQPDVFRAQKPDILPYR